MISNFDFSADLSDFSDTYSYSEEEVVKKAPRNLRYRAQRTNWRPHKPIFKPLAPSFKPPRK